MSLLSTPFHARAVEENRLNAWENRRGYTLARHYGNAAEEALAARFGAVIADLSWHWRVEFSGGAIEAFAARTFTRGGLGVGEGVEVLWLNDSGAVRGRGHLVRTGPGRYSLLSPEDDRAWLAFAAGLYGVSCYDPSTDGVLALIGPAAAKILAAAGIAQMPPPGSTRHLSWRGLDIALSRFGLGYEIRCEADNALIVWDRLRTAGRPFALMPAGQEALDTLLFESGLLVPGRDFAPARDGFGGTPTPQSLGLCPLIDGARSFNGKAAYQAAGPATRLWGIVLGEAVTGLPQPLLHQGRRVGHLLGLRYSPALQGFMGLCAMDGSWPLSDLTVGHFSCRPAGLPFLPIPAAEAATEEAGSDV